MTPLIDVVFLLLTFFVFALVLMVRAEVLGVSLPALGAAAPAQRESVITIAVLRSGEMLVNGEPAAAEALVERVSELRAATPGARLLLAADEGAPAGDLLRLMDRLTAAGLGEFGIVARPSDGPAEPGAPSGNENAPAGPGRP